MMETIVFYSFKGGTGRSLAVAQLAMLLKEQRQRVFVLDFDLGAPGQAEKLGPALKWTARPHFGLVEYLFRHQHAKTLETLDTKVVTFEHLKLLVAGDPFAKGDDYWRAYLDPEFQTFLALDAASDELILELKAKIVEDYDPAFLLVDAPSGVSRLAAMAIQLLAEKVVFMSANHDEGLLGTNFHLRKLQQAKKGGRQVPEPFCVLSRLPLQYSSEGLAQLTQDEEIDQIRLDALRKINFELEEDNRITKLFRLSSEPLLELHESLPMLDVRTESSPLVQDYIVFFSTLVPLLRDPLALRRTVRQELRPFMLIEEQGRMINPKDHAPNVALRVDTFVSTFMSIVETVSGMGDAAAAKEVLTRAGWTAATQFSKYLAHDWEDRDSERRTKLLVQDKLTEWCKFDSTVGFGKFGHKLWGTGEEGSIELENNFLVTDRPANGPNVCAFMTGYVTRVLEAVFPEAVVNVAHDDQDCGQYKKGDPTCTFRFTLEAVPPETK
jgi:predicted hydrocarbon binding protein